MLNKKKFEVFDKFKNLYFFRVFLKNVFRTLPRERETTRKNYRFVFEKSTFFDKKIEQIAEKNIVPNFLTKLYFFKIVSENILKTLVRGCEATKKKYLIVFEKF